MSNATQTATPKKPLAKARRKKQIAGVPLDPTVDTMQLIPANWLHPNPWNREFSKDDPETIALAESIRDRGQLEPIIVRPTPDLPEKHFEIICGRRRQLACQIAGVQVKCIVRNVSTPEAMMLTAIENEARQDLTAIEKARLMQRLGEPVAQGGGGLTQKEIVAVYGYQSAAAVSNLIRLLNLPAWLQAMISQGKLDQTYARELLVLPAEYLALPEFEKSLRQFLDQCEKFNDWPHRDDFAQQAIDTELVRPLEKDSGYAAQRWDAKAQCNVGQILFDPQPHIVELQPVMMPPLYRKKPDQRCCLNVKLWDQLQLAAIAELRKTGGKQKSGKALAAAKANGRPAATNKPSAAELKAKAKTRKEQFTKQITAWSMRWRRWWAAEQLQILTGPTDLIFPFLMACVSCNEYGMQGLGQMIERLAKAHKFKTGSQRYGIVSRWIYFLPATVADSTSTPPELTDTSRQFFFELAVELLWPKNREKHWLPIPDAIVLAVSNWLGFDPASAWSAVQSDSGSDELLDDFFALFAKDDLPALALELSGKPLAALVKAKTSKTDRLLVLADSQGLKLPKVLRLLL